MAAVDKKRLLKSRLPEAEVEVPGVGTVRVRGLSRLEVLELQREDTDGPGVFERKIVAVALVEPKLSEAEVAEWQAASVADELEPVTRTINELSGLVKDAAKEAYRRFESDPDAEFRVPTGGDAGDDGGAAPGGDGAR
jgi:hypothetical protein